MGIPEAIGGGPLVVDAFDKRAVVDAVCETRRHVVMQLTGLRTTSSAR
jgi:hypothetical protein